MRTFSVTFLQSSQLNVIHESFDAIPISKNYILQLHKIMYSHMNNPMAGKTKNVQNSSSTSYSHLTYPLIFLQLFLFIP